MTDDEILEIPERKIAPICLRCICDATSGCNKMAKCDENSCGMFNMTRQYWNDAGRQEITEETEEGIFLTLIFVSCFLIHVYS